MESKYLFANTNSNSQKKTLVMLQTWQHTANHGKDVCIKLLYIMYIQSEIVQVFLPLVLLTQYVLSA